MVLLPQLSPDSGLHCLLNEDKCTFIFTREAAAGFELQGYKEEELLLAALSSVSETPTHSPTARQ